MKISGLVKLTLLDFPSHTACCVFLQGCNFNCPFCYNSSLICSNQSFAISEEEFFEFLKKRKNKLDGVAISGGEPLLQPGIVDFIRKIKQEGFLVKLDTNGSFPEILQFLIEEKLVDYVAMDVKNSFEKYEMTTNAKLDLSKIKQSIEILLKNQVEYEFRTTVVKEFFNVDDFKIIGEMIKGASKYFLQSFLYKDSVLNKNLHALSKEELEKCLNTVKPYVKNVALRGIE